MNKLISIYRTCKDKLCKEFSPQRYFAAIIIALVVILAGSALIVFVLDPYMYWHESWCMKPMYSRSYAMMPGVMKQEKYDTVLFGSSMCQIFRINDINGAFGSKAVKATSPGLPGEALDKYLNQAVKHGGKTFHHAVIGVDFFAFAKDPKTSPRLQYEYLYGDSVLPLKYLLSRDSWEAVGEKIKYNMRDKFSKKGEYRVDYNLMFGHPPRSERYNKKALHKFVKKNNVLPAPIRENAYHNLENFLFANIRKHPEIKFDLFFPPYNIFFWCTLEKAGYVNGYLELRDYIIREAVKYPNVRLHDFQPDSTIVCNQDIYKDVTHYNVETGRLILQSMASGKHQIDVAAGVKNSQSIRQQIKQHMPEFLKLSPL